MSTPFVSGQVALLLSLQPELTPADTNALLRATAKHLVNPPRRALGGDASISTPASLLFAAVPPSIRRTSTSIPTAVADESAHLSCGDRNAQRLHTVNHVGGAGDALHDLGNRLTYGEYLQLDSLLAAQQPRTSAHDEMLFIVQHQTTELWFRLVLHELDAAMAGIDNDDLGPVFKNLARVERVFRVLLDAWEVLSTMTPADYMEFRHGLDASSGFQSHQYRLLEFALGNRDPVYLRPFAHRPDLHSQLADALAAPSLYDRTIALLARRGLPIADEVLNRDMSLRHVSHPSVMAAWGDVYRRTGEAWDLYELAEELVDLEDTFRQWRFRHVTTVERIIGNKPGTGGTSGVSYLKERLTVVLFPELWEIRTDL